MMIGAVVNVTAIMMLTPEVREERRDLVDPATEITRHAAHRRADDIRRDGGETGPDQHPLRTPDDAREDVAALVVRSEPVGTSIGRRCTDALERFQRLQWRVQGQYGRQDRHDHPEDHQGRTDHADVRLPEQEKRPEELAQSRAVLRCRALFGFCSCTHRRLLN